jgi:hypothetical protein
MPTPRENVTFHALSRILDAAELVETARRMLWIAESAPLIELLALDRTRAELHAFASAAVDRMFPGNCDGKDEAMRSAEDNLLPFIGRF